MVRNKKGWLRLVEAVISILIVLTAVMVVVVNKNNTQEQSGLCLSITPYLDEIAKNQTLREVIMTQSAESSVGSLTSYLKNRVEDPSLNFIIKTCSLNDECLLEEGGFEKIEICAGERIISNYRGQTQDLAPRKVKIFMFKR